MPSPLFPPEVLEPRRRQLGVPHRMLDGPMTEPILNGPGVVAGVRQCVAAAVAQHVGVHREIEAGAFAKALYLPIDGVRGERSAAFSGEDKAALRELPPQFTQRP